MPELPEVQTVINELIKEGILNKTFSDLIVYKSKLLKNSTPTKLKSFLAKESIKNIDRIGKYLVFKLTHDKILLIHLRMEGKLFYEKAGVKVDKKHLRVLFIFSNKYVLNFFDSRMFSTIHIFNSQKEFEKSPIINRVAIDPLNKNFNAEFLQKTFKKSTKAIKTNLLDQTKVSGIGNIYVDEILFSAKILPMKPTNKITKKDYENVAKFSTKILKEALKYKGTTISTFASSREHIGSYQEKLQIHGRKICPICKKSTCFVKLNGRGTTYCKFCQK
ncbi:MAG: DNA-formamidopyrimidine glycosylase [Mycoplasmataceae bacterium]|jgi:formamidopyrimidine-DNA glycosylase|nr:DNA-formamidopyrimidine glycosylase [Mycoplasmataceae bacterium]